MLPPRLDTSELMAEAPVTGTDWCRAHSMLVDRWLTDLYGEVVGEGGGVALLAVGGYGRSELAPLSDIDVVLLHTGRRDIAATAESLWYPLWDQALKLGHSVRTPREALSLAADDLETATSLLSARTLAGDTDLGGDLVEKAAALWRKRSTRWLAELSRSVEDRHRRHGEVAFLLEPDLKEGRGGLRDVHAVRWVEATGRMYLDGDVESVADAYDVLLSARVALHRLTGRRGDRLLLEDQDEVAAALGYGDADEMICRLSAAARRIAWTSDEVWGRVASLLGGPRQSRLLRDRDLGSGVVLREGEVALAATADLTDPLAVLRVAVAAATHDVRIERGTLRRLAARAPTLPDPWPAGARDLVVELLRTGRPAIRVVEALDHAGLWTKVLPEWSAVRSRPQRNAYHVFTVDRHLVEATANAAELLDAGAAASVEREDLLLLGTLLHDIGKGYPGDHTLVGTEMVGRMGERFGYEPEDVAVLQDLVRHHLLLPDVATRRDLNDDGTIRRVARLVGSRETLALLHALTEADSRATGPSAWGSWKAGLVSQLVSSTDHVLGGGAVVEVVGDGPTEQQARWMAAGEQVVMGDGDRLVVVAPDRRGMFSRVAGALSLNGLNVLEAAATTDEQGMALETFTVESRFGSEIEWERVLADVRRAVEGRLALGARLEERARVYDASRRRTNVTPGLAVLFDLDLSDVATVVEVHAPDGVGVLYRITRAISEMDLDVRSAKIQTLGESVVDSFYVCDLQGAKVLDADHLAELERAILHALGPVV